MTRAVLVCLAAIAAASCQTTATARHIALPYYDGADFTPRWAPVFHTIDAFALTTAQGERLTRDDLRGRIHIASFIYTRCAAICPLVVRELQKVQAATATIPGVVLVSFSVTPDEDSSATLADFGRTHAVEPDRWLLVTGARREIWSLARHSYFADDPRVPETQSPAGEAFLHTEKVLLVDEQLHLRGVYNGTSAFDMEHLIEDVRRLVSLDARDSPSRRD